MKGSPPRGRLEHGRDSPRPAPRRSAAPSGREIGALARSALIHSDDQPEAPEDLMRSILATLGREREIG